MKDSVVGGNCYNYISGDVEHTSIKVLSGIPTNQIESNCMFKRYCRTKCLTPASVNMQNVYPPRTPPPAHVYSFSGPQNNVYNQHVYTHMFTTDPSETCLQLNMFTNTRFGSCKHMFTPAVSMFTLHFVLTF